MKDRSTKAIICAALGNIIWGFGFLLTKVALSAASTPTLILAHRFIISSLCMAMILFFGKKRSLLRAKIGGPSLCFCCCR